MIWPPSIVQIRIAGNKKRRFRLWFPLFLAWPFVIAVGILLSPLVLLIAILTWNTGGKRLLIAGPMLFYTVCCIRGTLVNVKSAKEGSVYVAFK